MARRLGGGRGGWTHVALQQATLETTQGQILSQSPTDATRFWWHELTEETIDLPLGCLQGGEGSLLLAGCGRSLVAGDENTTATAGETTTGTDTGTVTTTPAPEEGGNHTISGPCGITPHSCAVCTPPLQGYLAHK